MESDLVKIKEWLLPASWIYGMGVGIRNALFDMHILKSRQFDVPVISVGNLTAGGTGKTPHIEYLIRLLSKKYKVAVLSRGYKRKSKGYVLAHLDTPVEQIGDESWQIRQKFRNIYVAVDKDRCRGIERLCHDGETRDVEVILLDDAYQHRYVKPGINILLVDYHRMITDDQLLPAGLLREPKEAKKRADIVIVTKCPHDIKPMGFRVPMRALDLQPHQRLFFSTMHYAALKGLFADDERHIESIKPEESVLLLSGIGSPEQMKIDLERYTQKITPMFFPDHHYFTPKDISKINARFAKLPSPKLVITTEKDATRLINNTGLSDELLQSLYVLPVEIDIMREEAENLNEKITGYVLKNSRNSILAKK